MPERKDLQKLIQRDRERKVKSAREAGWSNAKFVRRPLRPATARDRVYLFIFIFIASSVVTGAGYIFLLGQAVRQAVRYDNLDASEMYYRPIEAGYFPLICLLGGVVGVIVYAVVSFADPYGTLAAEKAEAKRQAERDEMLAEIRKSKFPTAAEHERAVRRLAELERRASLGQESGSSADNSSGKTAEEKSRNTQA